MLHDITEAAWFRGRPEKVLHQTLDFIDHDPASTPMEECERLARKQGRMGGPWRCRLQQHFPQKQICGPGVVCLDFVIATYTDEEAIKMEAEHRERMRRTDETVKTVRQCVKGPYRQRSRPILSTNRDDFMIRCDRAVTDFVWDEVLQLTT